MKGPACTIVLMSALLGGCGTHHAMAPMAPPAAALARAAFLGSTDPAELEQALTDRNIATRLNADVRAKLPTSLAVAKLSVGYAYAQVEAIDTEELKGWEKAVAAQALLTGVQPLSSLAVPQVRTRRHEYRPGTTLHGLRAAAATQKCELLLVYVRADSEVENLNDAAILYWTVLGLFVVPGTELEHKTVMQAILVDTRTGTILGTATGDSHLKKTTSAVMTGIEQGKMEKQAPEESLKDLQEASRKLLSDVVGAARASR